MNFVRKAQKFLREAYAELKKVVWPTRSRAARLTVIVVIVCAFYGAFIAAVDFGLSKGIQFVINDQQKSDQAAPPGAEGQTVPVQPGENAPVELPPGAVPQ